MADLKQAIAQLMLIGTEAHILQHVSLEEGGKMFLEKAKAAIGTYEYGWPSLSPDTIARKATGDSPLLETGKMRDSGGYEVKGDKVIIGFSDPKLLYHEYGTRHMPPRPVIGGTIDHHGQEIANHMGVVFGMAFGAALALGSATMLSRSSGGWILNR